VQCCCDKSKSEVRKESLDKIVIIVAKYQYQNYKKCNTKIIVTANIDIVKDAKGRISVSVVM
jgi:hypothetical protein